MNVTPQMLEAAHKAFTANWLEPVTDEHFKAVFNAMLAAMPCDLVSTLG